MRDRIARRMFGGRQTDAPTDLREKTNRQAPLAIFPIG